MYYDLCNSNYELVKVTKDGYSVIQMDTTTPLFKRKPSQSTQPKPKQNRKIENPLDYLTNILKIPNSHRLLFKVHVVSFFLESFKIPIMVLHGEQGSSKSTTASTVKRIVDPSPENLSSMPKKIDDLNISIYNKYLSNFDNISGFDHEISDTLCRAITGNSYVKRELYQDSKEVILHILSRIILNGITPNVEYPDLMERCIFYETKHIPQNERLTEEELESMLSGLLPALLDQIFSVLSNVFLIIDDIKPEIAEKPRMADFAVFGECIARTLDFEEFAFMEAYKWLCRNHTKNNKF